MNSPPNLDLIEKRIGKDHEQWESLKGLLLRMFEKDPDQRIGIYDIIQDPWVTRDGEEMVDLDLEELTSNDSLSALSNVGKVDKVVFEDINNDIKSKPSQSWWQWNIQVELRTEHAR